MREVDSMLTGPSCVGGCTSDVPKPGVVTCRKALYKRHYDGDRNVESMKDLYFRWNLSLIMRVIHNGE